MELTKEQIADLQVTRATTTPLWKGLLTMIKYRTVKNYMNPEFLGPRIGDKVIFALLVATLYLGIGNDFEPTNYVNIAAVLFMWSTLPACALLFTCPTSGSHSGLPPSFLPLLLPCQQHSALPGLGSLQRRDLIRNKQL